MMREWHFEEKVYKRWLVLMICSFEELIEELKKVEYKHIDEVPKASGFNFRFNLENSTEMCTMIWMPKFSQSVLAHELVHLVMHTFNATGVMIDIDNEEAFAFYMEYWFGEINRVYRKYPKGRASKQARA